jgi:tRNA(Arg) A34 adenosine deaminase TadA
MEDTTMPSDEVFMQDALKEADLAAASGEAPVGCIIVGAHGGEIARAHNLRESSSDPTARQLEQGTGGSKGRAST